MKRNDWVAAIVIFAIVILAIINREELSEATEYAKRTAGDAADRLLPFEGSKYPNPTAVHRGMRNNNPGNVEDTQSWKFKVPSALNTDGRFSQFYEMDYGIRAAAILLRNYINGSNSSGAPVNTIRKIINRWAPPTGSFNGQSYTQNTSGYIESVSKDTGWSADRVIAVSKSNMFKLLKAIFSHENAGELPTDRQIYSGIELAGIA